MPELPEVETVRRGLAPAVENEVIAKVTLNRGDLRFPFPDHFAERVSRARVMRLGRHAKFLCADLSSGETLIMHLGMSGRFTVERNQPGQFHHDTGSDPKHDHVIFEMQSGARITYNDPRRFGFMELWPTETLHAYPRLAHMGPEPLSNAFSAAALQAKLAGKATPIKAALLDQTVVAGLGNIYVCEALFRSGISPRRKASSIGKLRSERLAAAINAVISDAIAAGGSSISDFASTEGALGYFQHNFQVYDREGAPCGTCGAPVKRLVQSSRSSFYCGTCQR